MKQFGAPIPGQSLTTEPKAYPWERPPEITDPVKAIEMHLKRLSRPEVLNAALDMMELEDMDIHTLTKGVLRGAIASGMHDIDVAMLVAPVVHEFLRQAADAAGIEVDDGFEDKTAKKEEEASRQVMYMKKFMKEMPKVAAAAVEDIPKDMPKTTEEKRRGLMAKETV